MDILTDILSGMKFQSSFYFRTDLTAPWSVYVPPKGSVSRFHVVTHGQGWLHVDGQAERLPIANGDLVIIPHGAGHTIMDDVNSPARPLDDVLAEVSYIGTGPLIYGGGGPNTMLVCGEFGFDNAVHPLLTNLPPFLHVSGRKSYNSTWLDSALSFIAHESFSREAGALAVINRLSEIIFIQAIRAFADASNTPISFLAALGDPQISRALSAIHQQPSSHLTVEALGKIAGMSRSSFSNRFSDLVGMTPFQYITLTRMQQAAGLLTTTEDSLLQISTRVGYHSEAAFSTAFKRFYGVRPGEYRKQQAQLS